MIDLGTNAKSFQGFGKNAKSKHWSCICSGEGARARKRVELHQTCTPRQPRSGWMFQTLGSTMILNS